MRIWASKMRDSSGPARCSTRWPSSLQVADHVVHRLAQPPHLALDVRRAATVRSGTSGSPAARRTPGAQATPGETPMPRSERVTLMSPRTRWPPARPAPATACSASGPLARMVIELPHSAASIMTPMMLLPFTSMPSFGQLDLGRERAGQPHDPRGRAGRAAPPGSRWSPRARSQARSTGRRGAGPSRAARSARCVSEGPNQRDSAAPDRGHGQRPTAPAQPKPREIPAGHQRNREPDARTRPPGRCAPRRAAARRRRSPRRPACPPRVPVRSAQTAVPSADEVVEHAGSRRSPTSRRPARRPPAARPTSAGTRPAQNSSSPSAPSGLQSAVRSRAICAPGTASYSARAVAPSASPARLGLQLKNSADRTTASPWRTGSTVLRSSSSGSAA